MFALKNVGVFAFDLRVLTATSICHSVILGARPARKLLTTYE